MKRQHAITASRATRRRLNQHHTPDRCSIYERRAVKRSAPAALLTVCVLLLLLAAEGRVRAAQASAPAEQDATVVSLNGAWQFALAEEPASADRLGAEFHRPSFDARDFRLLPVPSNWAMHGFEEPLFTQWYTEQGRAVLPQPSDAEGFYLHRFRVADGTGKRTLLHFDGVWQSAEVWLNGNHLGSHEGGFTGFAFDVTEQIKPEAQNVLAVRVRQRTKTAMLDVNDDWALGGIYRDVWLETMPAAAYIDRVEAATDFDANFRDANLNLRLFIGRQARGAPAHNSKHQLYRARITLADKQGREVARTERAGAIGLCGVVVCGQEERIRIPVSAPLPWTAETPNLYDLRVDLLVDDRVVHTRTDRIGFREVSTAGGVLKINGKPIKLRGVARHDEHPETGRATTREHWLEDIRLMKRANINAVRTAHYPPAEGFIKLCDEMGLYVIEEVPMGFGGDLLLDPSFAGTVLVRAAETLRRDLNRPSIIIWSIGNEDPVTDLHLAAIRYVKSTDPTRPVLMPWSTDENLPAEIDILAPHYRTAADYDRMAATARRPVVTTEYTHAVGDNDFGGLEDRWTALTKHAAGAGGMIWLWADQGLRRKVLPGQTVLDPLADMGKYKARGRELVRHSVAGANEIYDAHGIFGSDGIINPDRTPQRDYLETRGVYAPIKVLTDHLPLTAKQPSASITVRNDFDFTDLSAVNIRWRLMFDERQLATGDARLNAAPHTTQTLRVPTTAITSIEADKSYYIELAFHHADGSPMVERSVRLMPGESTGATTAASTRRGSRPQVSGRASRVIVKAGATQYEFDAQTASLVRASVNDRQFITNARTTIWRPLTISETKLFRGGDERAEPVLPDLDRYTTQVRRWNVTRDNDAVRIEAEADHRVDDKNSFAASYEYRIAADGTLRVRYSILPRVDLGWVPEVGIEFETDAALDRMRWAGLGLPDSYPNERSAARFGVWTVERGSKESTGVKSGVEWAELMDASGNGWRLLGSPHVRFDEAGTNTGRLHLLSAVVGRSTKFRRPENQADQLNVSPAGTFAGSFTLKPLNRVQPKIESGKVYAR